MGTATVKAGGLTAEDGSGGNSGPSGWEDGTIRARSVSFVLRRVLAMPAGRGVVEFCSATGAGLLVSEGVSLEESSEVAAWGEVVLVAEFGAVEAGLIAVVGL